MFYFGLCLAFAIGGPASGAFLDLEGVGLPHGWQWLFLVASLLASPYVYSYCYAGEPNVTRAAGPS